MTRIPQRAKQHRPKAHGIVLASRFPTELDLQKHGLEPEYRGPAAVTPAPAVSMENAVAEMIANDEEWADWRAAELRGELFAKGRRR